jgi:ribose transport system ATP-binding protein
MVTLRLEGIAKTFPNGTVALRGVDLTLEPGKVHGLLGANGAGKSTLIKILAGAHAPTAGTVFRDDVSIRWSSPREAKAAGVATIYQHIPLVPTLSAIENILLDETGLWRDRAVDRARIAALVASLGDPFPLDVLVADLPIGARQMVAITQALASGAEVVVMDEPTASLAGHERLRVYETIGRLAAEGKAVLFVSHFINEIMALTDEVTVLRDGRTVLNAVTAELKEHQIAAAIAGRSVTALERSATPRALGGPVLEVRDLASPGKLAPTSFTLRAGEILGLVGTLGSGRSELLHAIFGADRQATGAVLLNGAPVGRWTDEAVTAGIALVPEDRAAQGYVSALTLAENIALPRARGLLLNNSADIAAAHAAIERLAIKASGPDALPGELSGGNAQKVVIAKWLTPDMRVLLLDEPTAGIDIGARTDILRLIRALADEGLPVILVSSEFEELLAVCDRLLVLRDGAVIGEADPAMRTESDLILLAGGSAPLGAAA